MKNTKIYLVGFILTLYFSFILQGTNNISNEQVNKENRNVTPPLTISNSLICDWNRTWGGADDDGGSGVAVDSSGNVYLSGSTMSFGVGGQDMVLVKYDGNGVQQWNRMWGGADDDGARRVAVDSSSNVYLSGSTMSFGVGGEDMVLVKYSQDSYKPAELAIPLELILIILIISGGAMIGVATIMLIRRKSPRLK